MWSTDLAKHIRVQYLYIILSAISSNTKVIDTVPSCPPHCVRTFGTILVRRWHCSMNITIGYVERVNIYINLFICRKIFPLGILSIESVPLDNHASPSPTVFVSCTDCRESVVDEFAEPPGVLSLVCESFFVAASFRTFLVASKASPNPLHTLQGFGGLPAAASITNRLQRRQ